MSNSVFLKPIEFYQRDLNPIKNYFEQMAFYAHKMTNLTYTACHSRIMNGFKNKEGCFSKVKNPNVIFFERNEVGDTFPSSGSLSEYIKQTNDNGHILAPTLTTYLHPSEKSSILVGYLDENVAGRSKAKKEAFKAKSENNNILYILKNNEQTIKKLANNSMSGSFATAGSVLHNPSAHSTLTSITRTEGSLGNACNEKFLAGNRYYATPSMALNNLIAITSSLEREELSTIIDRYNLIIPTVDDVIACVKYSTDFYWKDINALNKIRTYVEKLDDIERAGFVYIGDLYHLRKHNPEFILKFLNELSVKVTSDIFDEQDKMTDSLYKLDEQVVNLGHLICYDEVKGFGKKYKELPIQSLNTLYLTVLNIINVVENYRDFINAFFLTKHIPSSTADIKDMLRRVVVLSDTDSTMFSVDEYINWKYGKIVINSDTTAFASAVMFLTTQCIAHALAIFSANMNVERVKLFDIAMKPEYSFPVFAQTPVAKHYFTFKDVQEGNVFNEPELEIKGVHLKNSASPKELIKDAHNKMKEILFKVKNNERISIIEEIIYVANVERKIINLVLNNNTEYFKKSKIKQADAYKKEQELSPYLHHNFWLETFSSKYGEIPPPPYSVIKIPTVLVNITAVKEWIDSIKDETLNTKLKHWFVKTDRVNLPTIYLSTQYVNSFGIPEEIKSIIDVRKIVLDLSLPYRMILDTLGYCVKTGMLVSEQGYK